jgi:hypothetical protein
MKRHGRTLHNQSALGAIDNAGDLLVTLDVARKVGSWGSSPWPFASLLREL